MEFVCRIHSFQSKSQKNIWCTLPQHWTHCIQHLQHPRLIRCIPHFRQVSTLGNSLSKLIVQCYSLRKLMESVCKDYWLRSKTRRNTLRIFHRWTRRTRRPGSTVRRLAVRSGCSPGSSWGTSSSQYRSSRRCWESVCTFHRVRSKIRRSIWCIFHFRILNSRNPRLLRRPGCTSLRRWARIRDSTRCRLRSECQSFRTSEGFAYISLDCRNSTQKSTLHKFRFRNCCSRGHWHHCSS